MQHGATKDSRIINYNTKRTKLAKGANKPEVVIIGAGLGGLSAAIYLRLEGYDVVIYEANDKVGGRANVISKYGFKFDTGPSLLNYPWVFEDLFKAAGRNLYDYVTLLPVDPSITFQWPTGEHFQLSSNLATLLAECERIEPGSGVNLVSFLEDANAKYRLSFDKLINRNEDNPLKWFGSLNLSEIKRLSVWRSLNSELKRFFKQRYIREAFGSYGMYLGGSPFDLPGLFTILAYGELAYGLWLPKGGIYSLVQGIEKLAIELGIQIQTNQPVQQVVIENGNVVGVELSNGKIHPATIVVSNVDVPTTNLNLIGKKDQAQPIGKNSKQIEMTPGVITYYWGIKGKVRNLRHHTIYLPDDYKGAFRELFKNKIPNDLPFYVSAPSLTDPSLAPIDSTAMFVLAPTPLISEMKDRNWDQIKHSVKEHILRRLRKHEVRIDEEQIAFEEIWTPLEWSEKFGLYNGSAFGQSHKLFQVGPFRSKNYSTEYHGLYYVGASTTPGTGMPMVILSGKLTAERIKSHSKHYV